MPPTHGILYIAAGEKYIRAAIQSATSALKHCPDLPIHLFADWQNYDVFDFDQKSHPFTSVEKIIDPHRRSKVDYMPRAPFDFTLYLDTDTMVNADIREMFQILERFDIALNHAHRRSELYTASVWRTDLPQAFPQYNSGVMLYRKTPAVIKFLEDWRNHFQVAGFQQDQMTLRELIWLSDLRIATLPPEYNIRYIKYHYLWSKSEATAKIFHLQMYHDGPFWFIKNWFKKIGRVILFWLGVNPNKLKKTVKK